MAVEWWCRLERKPVGEDAVAEVFHLNARAEDFQGNKGVGRYVLLPGSDGRAAEIAKRLQNVVVKESDRRLNCYFGDLQTEQGAIGVAVVSTGMGCPSMDIVLNELIILGAKRFIRLGTAGSLQHGLVNFGDYVIATGSVRDEGTTSNYAPLELPAIADLDVVRALETAARKERKVRFHKGLVHCKDSLYAREFGVGPLAEHNRRYMETLTRCGVLASEMETAQLFIRSQIESQVGRAAGESADRVKSGAILAIVGDDVPFSKKNSASVIGTLISIGLGAVTELSTAEQSQLA